jgi:hypothetical protein
MSLDLVIPAEKGAPESSVSISVEEHARLLSIATDAGLSLLSRLQDYYGDATFEVSELDALNSELQDVSLRTGSDHDLKMLVLGLVELVQSAKLKQRPVLALAD